MRIVRKCLYELLISVIIGSVALISTVVAGGMGASGSANFMPHVKLRGPLDEIMDLRDTDTVTFKWSTAQRPPNGRKRFQFRLFKTRELLYDNILISEDLTPRVKDFTIKTDIFENGKKYVWSVRQQDREGNWSGHSYQSFEVLK